jgi:hypothetical protein
MTPTVVLSLTAVLIALSGLAAHLAHAQDKPFTYDTYLKGTSLVSTYFFEVYNAFGEQARYRAILEKCGHKKEADEIQARILPLIGKKIDHLIWADLSRDKLTDIEALKVANEGTMTLWTGYQLGFRDSFGVMSGLLPTHLYESICKLGLQKAREWRENEGNRVIP